VVVDWCTCGPSACAPVSTRTTRLLARSRGPRPPASSARPASPADAGSQPTPSAPISALASAISCSLTCSHTSAGLFDRAARPSSSLRGCRSGSPSRASPPSPASSRVLVAEPAVERVRALGLDHVDLGNALGPAPGASSHRNPLPSATSCPGSRRHDQVLRDLPLHLLRNLHRRGLCPSSRYGFTEFSR